jgi:hypothetical protein
VKRRFFLELCGLATASLWYPATTSALCHPNQLDVGQSELRADIVIIGGGLGGCAAALAALRAGRSVIMTEPTDWIGGQLTQQAVPPDEHKWIETTGCTAIYRELRNRIRDYYRRNYPMTDAARNKVDLNPGNGAVSRLCHEPRVALAVLDELFAEAMSSGKLTLLLNTIPTSATTDRDRITSVSVRSATDSTFTLVGQFFIDASEQGDLLPLTNTEFVIGRESKTVTAEPNAPGQAEPTNIQSFTWCYAIDYVKDEDHTIEKPADYDFWRDHVPKLNPPWPGKLLSLTYPNPRTLMPRELSFVPGTAEVPVPKTPTLNLWMYRRIIDPTLFTKGTYSSGISIVNWPQNDYMLGPIISDDKSEVERHLKGSKQLSLSLLYWLQTEAPRPDGQSGWKGLRLRRDIVGTEDGLAKYPYIRESRRIEAEFTIVQQHLTRQARSQLSKTQDAFPRAESFSDSVGIGYYPLDLHPRCGGNNYLDMESLPFQLPLGSLIPKRVENLIAAAKNIGTTHISNGCYRLHPVEWNIGEVAGTLAHYCLTHQSQPRQVRNNAKQLADFQTELTKRGIDLAWDEKILAAF